MALAAAESRASGLSSAIWTLIGGLGLAILFAVVVLLRAGDRTADIAEDRAGLFQAREAVTLAAQTFREGDPKPGDLADLRTRIAETLRPVGVEPATLAALDDALFAIAGSPEQALSKEEVAAFETAAAQGLAELAEQDAGLVRRLDETRRRFLTEASLVVAAALVALAGALGLLWGALKDQRRLLSTARQEAERMSALLTASADGIFTLTEDGRIEAANGRAYAMLGLEPGSLVGRRMEDWLDVSALDESESSFHELAQAIMTMQDAQYETTVLRADGTRFAAALTVAEYEDGQARRLLATLRDVTRRKEAEAAKDAFVSTVSHELRTPLTSIAGSLDLLAAKALGENPPPQAARLVEIAQSNAHRLIRLINDILDLEKLESGRTSLDVVDMSLRDLAEAAIEANADYASPHSVTFRLNMLEPEVMVRGDRDRLMQVANNLLSNAVKASPEGAIVEVSVLRAGAWGEFAVRDYGPGVPREFEPELFKKFAQAERAAGSTGLGLALVREIAEQLGGRAYHQRALPTGAIFTIALPLAELDMPADACPSGAPEILHLDPDPDSLSVVAHAFSGRARVRQFVGALEARDALRRRLADAILIDLTTFDDGELAQLSDAAQGAPMIAFSADRSAPAARSRLAAEFVKSRHSLDDVIQTVLRLAGPNGERLDENSVH